MECEARLRARSFSIVLRLALGIAEKNLFNIARAGDAALFEADSPVAKRANRRHVVADEKHRAAFVRDFVHSADALFLEGGVAHGQHFVDEQNLRNQVRRHGERQTKIHAGGIALYRRIDELLDFGESDDFVELRRSISAFFMPRIAPLR